MVRSGHHSRGSGRGRNYEDSPPAGNHGNEDRAESPPPEEVEEEVEEEAAGSTYAEPPRRRYGPDGRIVITLLDGRYVRNFNLQLIIIILFVKFKLIFFYLVI